MMDHNWGHPSELDQTSWVRVDVMEHRWLVTVGIIDHTAWGKGSANARSRDSRFR